MANSMFVPLLRLPSGIDEVRSFIDSAFAEFNLPLPMVRFENKESPPVLLTDGFFFIEGIKEGDQCWVSVSRCSKELTGDEECSILADVKTRGSWIFAGIVAYAFCRAVGHIVLNDAGELDGQESYNAESLRKLIAGWSEE